jgi:hypothetical protein
MEELPACFFPPEVERTYDRSVMKYLEIQKKKLRENRLWIY